MSYFIMRTCAFSRNRMAANTMGIFRRKQECHHVNSRVDLKTPCNAPM